MTNKAEYLKLETLFKETSTFMTTSTTNLLSLTVAKHISPAKKRYQSHTEPFCTG